MIGLTFNYTFQKSLGDVSKKPQTHILSKKKEEYLKVNFLLLNTLVDKHLTRPESKK